LLLHLYFGVLQYFTHMCSSQRRTQDWNSICSVNIASKSSISNQTRWHGYIYSRLVQACMHAIVAVKSSQYCLFPWSQTHAVTHRSHAGKRRAGGSFVYPINGQSTLFVQLITYVIMNN
jgi:hypothetical protein